MIVYNITAKVSPAIAEDWLAWQKQEHIPQILATSLIEDYKIFRLLEQDEEEGLTFVIQFYFASWENYDKYIRIFSDDLRALALNRWQDQYIAFRTVMQLVN